MKSPMVLRLLGVLSLVLCLFGCAGTGGEVVWRDAAVDRAWPELPEKPRLRFLRTVAAAGNPEERRSVGRLVSLVTGESGEGLPLKSPYGVAADGEGRIWVTDSALAGVHWFDLKRGRGGLISSAGPEPFATPVGVAFDPRQQRLYVSDSTLNRVVVLDGRGRLLGDRIPAEGYARPGGLALDAAGRLYVVDVLKGVVQVFAPDGRHERSLGSGAAPEGRFSRPSNVAIGPEGNIHVLDSMNFRVETLAPDGHSLGTIGVVGTVPGTFARPRGIAVDSSGHVYVSDAAFDNIQVFDPAGRLLLDFGSAGNAPGRFNLPAGLFIDGSDRLYVVDAMNGRLQVYQYLGEAGP